MMDEEFLKRKEIVWYRRILTGAVVLALIICMAAICMMLI